MTKLFILAGVLLVLVCVAIAVRNGRAMKALSKLHYWLAFEAPRPLNKLAPLVDRLMAFCER